VLVVANGLTAAAAAACWWKRVIWNPLFRISVVAEASVVLQVLIGLGLLAANTHRPHGIHYVYGIATLIVVFVARGVRREAVSALYEEVEDFDALPRRDQVALARRSLQREIQVITIAALTIVTLALRALGTA
jgi:hypothetical protein